MHTGAFFVFFLIVLSFFYLFLNKMDDALYLETKYQTHTINLVQKQKIKPVKKNLVYFRFIFFFIR